jgi:predicted polyphosphate/ATP-dependent NAD kinase
LTTGLRLIYDPDLAVSPGPVAVGVVANPAAGRDIRRLVAGASVFDNAEKGNMVHRLMCGLGATGVDRVVMMPAGAGLVESLRRRLVGRTGELANQPLPELELLDQRLTDTADDTAEAVRRMRERGVRTIVVLGGDGTHRIVAKHSGRIPLCTLSTGTNNAFAELREATVAGLATGLVATGRVASAAEPRPEKLIAVSRNGEARADCALVDVALGAARWVGARAIWRIGDIRELYVTFARPDSVGLSSIAGQLEPVARTARHGLRVRLVDPARAPIVLLVPVAPGLVAPVGVAGFERIEPGRRYPLERVFGSLALDGERELELTPDDEIALTLEDGPLRIDVGWVMAEAARCGALASTNGKEGPWRQSPRPKWEG